MAKYCVNKNAQKNGTHEVHVLTCPRCPVPENQQYLGLFTDSQLAVASAKLIFPLAKGCFHCCMSVTPSLLQNTDFHFYSKQKQTDSR